MLQENETMVKVGIKRYEVSQETLLREEESGKCDIHMDTLVHCLAEDPTNEMMSV